jgi:hypothetical protein
MKTIFAAILLLITQVIFSQVAADKLISVHYNNRSAEEVLKDLQQTQNISFSYAPSLLPLDKKISLNADNKPVKQVLDELAQKLGVGYEIISNQVVFKAKAKPAPKQNIRGQVIDESTQQPLEGAIVKVLNTEPLLAAVTDSTGEFKIEGIPVGRWSLSITYMGYSENVLPDLRLDVAKELVVSVPMKSAGIKMSEVTVYSANRGVVMNEMASMSATSISAEETKRFVAAAFDPARVALNYAGVAPVADLNNELVIRGNSPKGVMYRMEGVEIVNPNHFSGLGSTGGAISMLSNSTLANSDFYTGAFPAEFGNSTSGVLDLKLRTGNNERREHSFMIGVLGIEAATEGYFTKKSEASYLFNYRYSTLGLMSYFIPGTAGTLPNYQDLSFKINIPTRKSGVFSVWGIMGMSMAGHKAPLDTSKWIVAFDSEEFSNRSMKGAYGLSHKMIVSKNSYLHSVISYSGDGRKEADYRWHYDTMFYKTLSGDIRLKNHYIRLSEMYNWKVNSKSTLRAGLILSTMGFSYNFYMWDTDSNRRITRYATSGWTEELQAYAQWQQQLHPDWTLDAGVHFTYLFLNNTYAIDPRTAIRYRINRNNKLGLAVGLHSKPEDLSSLLYSKKGSDETYTQPNRNLLMPKALHTVLGYELTFLNDFQFKAEAYFQYLFHQGINSDPNSALTLIDAVNAFYAYNNPAQYVSKGTGMNYGLDVTLQKYFSKNYYFLFTASVFNSTYKTLGGKTHSTQFNRNYTMNAMGGKEFRVGKNKASVIGVNAKVLVMGGNRYTPLDEAASIAQNEVVQDWDRVNEARSPLYFRLDIGVSYKTNYKRTTHTLMLDIQNVANYKNVQSQSYNEKTKAIEYLYQQGLFPLFNYRLEFSTK